MSLMKDKYKQLKPTLDYLSDPVVLAQAWKKSHSYIRSHNWYADMLELDASAINLEANLIAWGKELAAQCYQAKPMRLVPAPKTDVWTFESRNSHWEWRPAKTQTKLSAKRRRAQLSEPLRPLAHLTIKDQTVATAMMMCMADAVETAQGPTDGIDIASYGNRLFCSWDEGRARFRWGSSTTYSKYFQDYQRFLKRTAGAAKNLESSQASLATAPRAIYEVQLDMSAFYDSIDRIELLSKLRQVVDGYHGLPREETEHFWNAVERCFLSWKWSRQDSRLNPCLKMPLSNNGLPQGLVASGFFANVYLLDFDTACRGLAGSSFNNFTIHEYCRYVDDLRIVISVDENTDSETLESIKQSIVTMLGRLLPPEGRLQFNPDKTKLIRLSGEDSDASSQMSRLQSITSGPMDLDSLIHVENSLDSLFLRAEVSLDDRERSSLATCTYPLATVHQVALDVREDTVLRFAANRWTKVLKAKRRLATSREREALDTTQEAVARRFVASWARNPALTLLLKKGLQLFPSETLLRTVWDPLVDKLSDATPLRERCIASYCLAEICRFSVTDLRRTVKADLPQTADLDGYYTYIYEQVRSLIQRPVLPWYLKQQAGLLLVGQVQAGTCQIFEHDGMLAQVMSISLGCASGKPTVIVPAALVAWQMLEDPSPVIRSVCAWLDTLGVRARKRALQTIAVNNSDLFLGLVDYLQNNHPSLSPAAKAVSEILGLASTSLPVSLADWQGSCLLADVIQSPANPFVHENALIKLAIAAVECQQAGTGFFLLPQAFTVSCENWKSIQDPRSARLTVRATQPNMQVNADARYAPAPWVPEVGDGRFLYTFGCLLRACAVGSCDFTASHVLFRQDISDGYMGLKTSWYKRRMGMMHSPESLVGEAAPMSGWITELLFILLQWPGLDTESWEQQWPTDLSLATIKPILKSRLEHQLGLYGVASDMPLYVQRVMPPADTNDALRVVTVQSLLPKRSDFEAYGVELNDSSYREKHRGHLADLCNLVLKKLETMDFVNGRDVEVAANLIVFPELSVHQDDVDLLEALSAKTKAMVFAGIVFHQHENKLINRALWLIPYRASQGGLRWIKRWQGKWNLTKLETNISSPWRPYQLLIELVGTLPHLGRGYRLSGAICYDATDMRLTADLRDHSDAFLIAALNNDITTFDNMIDALHYHMYQHVVLVNTGEFGGSAAKAPFKLPHHRQIIHSHGSDQISVSVFKIDMLSLMVDCPPDPNGEYSRQRKTKPAGIKRHGIL
ncbi:RNA-directed DNA polymerase [Chromobacterium haemolyticum]|uniref:RNA-directed DNA polymerase n=1 Tax=Chromobacterium haemolyticum TaxID=394935 RepID=UPI004055563D